MMAQKVFYALLKLMILNILRVKKYAYKYIYTRKGEIKAGAAPAMLLQLS